MFQVFMAIITYNIRNTFLFFFYSPLFFYAVSENSNNVATQDILLDDGHKESKHAAKNT
jgi:hypothetical protein